MKREDINTCLRQYKKSVDTYRFLADQLRALGTDDRSPLYRKTKRAEKALAVMGRGLAFLPELAVEIRELQRICGLQRHYLEAAGIQMQYRERSGEALEDEDGVREGEENG